MVDDSFDRTDPYPDQDMRYERKTVVEHTDISWAVHIIKTHRLLFSEIYKPRQVNSIYFDDANYRHYSENIQGVAERRKIRIRWYTDPDNPVSEAIVEVKEKKALVGRKLRAAVGDFQYGSEEQFERLTRAVQDSSIPMEVKEYFKYLTPTICCSYLRSYYLSADKRYRLTLDRDLTYTKLSPTGAPLSSRKDPRLVIEVKYDRKDEGGFSLFEDTPLRITKNSKYVNAIEQAYFS